MPSGQSPEKSDIFGGHDLFKVWGALGVSVVPSEHYCEQLRTQNFNRDEGRQDT